MLQNHKSDETNSDLFLINLNQTKAISWDSGDTTVCKTQCIFACIRFSYFFFFYKHHHLFFQIWKLAKYWYRFQSYFHSHFGRLWVNLLNLQEAWIKWYFHRYQRVHYVWSLWHQMLKDLLFVGEQRQMNS